jgi:hypothetical protein
LLLGNRCRCGCNQLYLATTAVTGSNVGLYYCGTRNESPNYTVTKTDAVLTVTPKAVTVVD